MDGVKLVPLDKFQDEKGSIFHVIKHPVSTIEEVYVSTVKQKIVKGWKRHNRMTLNLVVIQGDVKFTISDDIDTVVHVLGESNYARLVVDPGLWVCFEGLQKNNMIINCANFVHDVREYDSRPLEM